MASSNAERPTRQSSDACMTRSGDAGASTAARLARPCRARIGVSAADHWGGCEASAGSCAEPGAVPADRCYGGKRSVLASTRLVNLDSQVGRLKATSSEGFRDRDVLGVEKTSH